MVPDSPLTEAEKLLIDAYTSILNDPFEDKYEDRWEDEPFDKAVDDFKVRAQEIGFTDPFELLSRYKVPSYEAIRTQLKKGPAPCFRPGWESPLLGVRFDIGSILAKCEHVSGPEFDSKYRVVIMDFWASWCDPCVQAGPDMSDLADEFAGRIAVVGINNESIFGATKDPDIELLQNFLNENKDGFRYTNFIDNAEGHAKESAPQDNFRPTLEQALEAVEAASAREE
ncbi:hypothetical protein BGX27_005624 [Mortierella sp. AM989]|nr:hypothetical protein BGX27_005624 [Mortierella sp. AM989]